MASRGTRPLYVDYNYGQPEAAASPGASEGDPYADRYGDGYGGAVSTLASDGESESEEQGVSESFSFEPACSVTARTALRESIGARLRVVVETTTSSSQGGGGKSDSVADEKGTISTDASSPTNAVRSWIAPYAEGINMLSTLAVRSQAHERKIREVVEYETRRRELVEYTQAQIGSPEFFFVPNVSATMTYVHSKRLSQWKRSPPRPRLTWGVAPLCDAERLLDQCGLLDDSVGPKPVVSSVDSTKLSIRLELIFEGGESADGRPAPPPVVVLRRVIPLCTLLMGSSVPQAVRDVAGKPVYTKDGKVLADAKRLAYIAPENLLIESTSPPHQTSPSAKIDDPSKSSEDGSYVYVVLAARRPEGHEPGTRLRTSREKEVVQVTIALGEAHCSLINGALLDEYGPRKPAFDYCSRRVDCAGARYRLA